MSKRFIWRHFVDNVEVSKDEFLKRLGQHYLTCDTNYDNPLLNVCFVDEKATQSKYDSIKRRNGLDVKDIPTIGEWREMHQYYEDFIKLRFDPREVFIDD